MSLMVLKFGGSSVGDSTNFADPAHLQRMAGHVKTEIQAGHQVVVVISAMAGETRRLKQFSSSLNDISLPREDDVILAAGEQISAGLFAKLLHDPAYGLTARSCLGWQIPIITDTAYSNAQILSVETDRIHHLLHQGIIPVIAGFQGLTAEGCISTLGFDGSDTTAVAVAGALGADICRFYKDVRGLYTANPRRVPKARKLETLSLGEMRVLSELGARILHPSAVQTALDHTVKLHIVPNFEDAETGTWITPDSPPRDRTGITYYQTSEDTITVSLVGHGLTSADRNVMQTELASAKILTEVVPTAFDHCSITLTLAWMEQLDTALQILHTVFGFDSDRVEKPAYSGTGKQVFDPAIGKLKG